MVVTRTIGRAMAQQVERVNTADPARIPSEAELHHRRVNALEADNTALRDEIAALHRQIKRLKALISSEHLALIDDNPAPASMFIDNRAVMTPAQAARWVGVSVATVSRYIDSGYWEAKQPPGSNRWYVFADVPLTVKRRK